MNNGFNFPPAPNVNFYISVQKQGMNQMPVKTNNIKQTVPLFQTYFSKTSAPPVK